MKIAQALSCAWVALWGIRCSSTTRSQLRLQLPLGIPPEQKLSPLEGDARQICGNVYVEFIREKAGEYESHAGTAKLYINDKVVAEGPMRTQTGKFTFMWRWFVRGPRQCRRCGGRVHAGNPGQIYWRHYPVCGGVGREGTVPRPGNGDGGSAGARLNCEFVHFDPAATKKE